MQQPENVLIGGAERKVLFVVERKNIQISLLSTRERVEGVESKIRYET
jgi:hypothetical protein